MLKFALKHCSQRVRRVFVDHIKYFSIIGYGFNKSGIQFMARDYALFLQTSKWNRMIARVTLGSMTFSKDTQI